MKKLILTTLLVSTTLYAAGPIQEIVDGTEGKQVISIVKDIEIKDMLEKTGEFSKCRQMNPFKAGDSDTEKSKKIESAEKCFQDQLKSSSGNAKKLKELSESLNLQSYGLVQSKNIKDIQNYLSDKMYESMTGVNRKEADQKKLIDSMKFGKKKNIDQKTFVDLYKTQLGKNALYEVSRFCFQNLRSSKIGVAGKENFAEYWANYTKGSLKVDDVDDLALPVFGKTLDTTDKKKVYEDIFTSIQGSDKKGMDETAMGEFFLECGKLIVPLCKKFQDSSSVDEKSAATKSNVEAQISRGAAACLAKNRIQEYKSALANAEKLSDYFEKEMKSSDKGINLMLAGIKGEPIKIFGDGKDANEQSIDDLTNNASSDFIGDDYGKDKALEDKLEKCKQNPEFASCEGVISQGDELDKAKHDIDMEMTLKRDVEMARVRKLKQDNDATLDEYLKENGFFDILEDPDYKDKKMTEDQLVEKIGKAYEAKKIATLATINNSLGKRQVSKDVKAIAKPDAEKVVQETKEERARLAQVVLFNNIITSHLSLKKKNSSGGLDPAGRNVNAWKKEEQALQGKVDDSYFANIKKSSDGATGIGKDSQIAGFEILDQLLGKEDKNSN